MGKRKSKATNQHETNSQHFHISMIAAGLVVASAHAQSFTATNRNGNFVPSPPDGQKPFLTRPTNSLSTTYKRPLPPRLNSVSPGVVKPVPSMNPVHPQQNVRLQQPVPAPQPIATVEAKPLGTQPPLQK
jgi:hypothetical protein